MDWKIDFYLGDRTIVYEDAHTQRIFTYKYDIADYKARGTSNRILLDPGPGLSMDFKVLKCESGAEEVNVAVIKYRIREHFAASGLDVVIPREKWD